ncbi:MAG: glycosyltransferase family 8 protein [Clostridia bacterium]|nr:glycosyltransferase family 8 protein [Clostridia bacterium]
MNILVTLDSNYVSPLCVMLRSLVRTTRGRRFEIYVIHSSLTQADLDRMTQALDGAQAALHPIVAPAALFEGVPVLDRLSRETYYRLLLGELLPETVHRVLYLDPDIVINRDLSALYDLDLCGKTVAAAPHLFGILERVNLRRLGIPRGRRYVNAGVLLFDLDRWRAAVTAERLFSYINANVKKLLLADQDVLNVLMQDQLLYVDERLYNLDEKTYRIYHCFGGHRRIDLPWVRAHAVVIHYNGKHKPWRERPYRGKLGEFFEAYQSSV